MKKRILRTGQLGLLATAVVLAGASLVACGDSSDDGPSADPAAGGTGEGGDARGDALDIIEDAVDDTPGDARATVVIDGVTYQFRPLEPGPDDDFSYSYCSVVAGSLQGGMQLVDDAGAYIEGGEIDFILLEPGGLYESTGDPAELSISLPDRDDRTGYLADEIDAPASGRTASGTFTASNHLGETLSGTIDASC
mgnify:FL=1